MKKNFVKKLALAMALTLAVGSVPSMNVEAAAAAAFKSTKVNLKVGQTKKYNTVNSTKKSVKFVIGNKKIATVDYKKGNKYCHITGVAAGKTRVRAEFKDYKTKKVTINKMPVEVKEAVVEAKLNGVKQTASNAFVATFTADASKKFTKDNFAVTAADGTTVLSVKSVDFAADGLSATVTLYGNFADGVAYNVACGDANVALTATVGAVARVAINTAQAQENVKTPIEFTLFDATGIDVTPSVALDANCIITITGSYSGAELDKASDASLTMDTVGSTADVTVTYNSNAVGAEDVSATQTIVCVDAKAVIGTKVFVSTNDVNAKSESAKFYKGLSDTTVAVPEDGVKSNVYFCVKDANGDVISYDSYEAESSNDDVMSVSVSRDSGKFAQFTVNGNTKGNAQINITATKNGKASYYTIPVTVSKVGVAVKMTVSVDKPTMSNVDDSEYTNEITATFYDALGNEVSGSTTFERITNVTTGTAINVDANGVVTAANAQAKTYTVKVTGADDKTGDTFVKNVNILVKNLPTDNPLKLTYQVELNSTALDQNPDAKAPKTARTRLYATYNGLFAGYVRDNGSEITVAEDHVKANADTALSQVDVVAKYGTKTFAPNGNLVTTGSAMSIGANEITFDSVINGSVVEYKEDSATLAKVGAYTIQYELSYVKDAGKTPAVLPTKKTVTFTVKNTVFVPTVKVLSKVAESFDNVGIAECLKTNVDMNNNDSEHESIYDIAGTTQSNDGLRFTVKYAVVEDNYGDTTWRFWVPINTTFKAE